ncbi:MAG: PRC-barrel domain-containing protein [Drouetiella hepatica Uher 2000/2452]|jgi:uncharacterized protein YrrD|uniref:PRC-barrel domain-containing protein n=1 Tax=Drouetiella hepatica Uher 2000/2452 TaxID=904376 RepID=A0A951QDC8_9CYAN|nr:PRC-barrel domain-containing protein [Drouetiella hepatica Uher 2000/2452]
MRKGSDILGKAVVAYDKGESFCRVKDLVFDQDSNQLLALLVEEGGWFSDAQVIPFQSIQAIGLDAVIVPAESAVVRVSQLPEVKRILDRNNVLKGTHIMTTDGRDLGKMIDLYFDEHAGVIDGYEVSGGLFADAYSGRSYVPAPHTLKIGEDVAFVPSEVADLMEEQIGGIKGAMQTAGEKVQSAALTAGEKVQSAALTAGEKIQGAAQETGYKLQEAGRSAMVSATNLIIDPAEQKAFAIGRTAQDTVTATDGTVIVRAGQSITLLNAEWAEEKGALDLLYQAAGGDVRQRATERLQAGAQDAGVKIQGIADRAGNRFQEVRQDTTIAFTKAVISPTEQKEFAIGKISQWTVAATNGVVLVLGGQEITPAAAAYAEQSGLLDELYRAAGGRLHEHLALRADSAAAGYVVEQAKGRRVQQIVRTRSGLIVAAPGQIVTDIVIERAKLHHAERDLLNAVGLSTATAIRARANGTAAQFSGRFNATTQTTGAQLVDGTDQIKDGARSLWEQIKTTATSLQERSARTVEEQRIKGALGRPVTRVILDENDDVILNVGELTTHQAIDSARQAGVLDVLLSSIYTQSPQFSKAEMQAPEAGRAALTASAGDK